MKFSKRVLNVLFLFVFVISFVVTTCVSEAAIPKTTRVSLSKSSVSLYKGQLYKLNAKKANSKVKHKSVKWSTSNKKVVIVNQKGYIKGMKKGTAYVYCKVKWKNNKTTTVKCKVKVYNPVKLKSYQLSKTSLDLKVGQKATVKKVIKPTNATIIKNAIATSNKKVAIINSKGVVTAKGVGTAKICIAIKTYNGKVYKKYVTVKVTNKSAVTPTVQPTITPGPTTKPSPTTTPGPTTPSPTVVPVPTVTPTPIPTPEPTEAPERKKFEKAPYISTYYFNPKPSCKENIVIPIYVTDTQHKDYLFDDDSKRFDLEIEVDGIKTSLKDLKAGDHNVNLGKLEVGNHYFAMQVIDKDSGIKSHKLYNDLKVVDPDVYSIKESETYYMKDSDLQTYSIDYSNNEDKDVCIATKNGLNKLFADIRDEGYRKIVLLKGTYRIDCEDSKNKSVEIPSGLTVDMNGATFKLNTTTTQDSHGSLVRFNQVVDAHLTNGILEGNRFERKDLGLETSWYGEQINTVIFNGSKYCSITDLDIKDTAGHTVYSQYVWKSSWGINEFTPIDIVDGKEVEATDCRTSEYVKIDHMKKDSDYIYVGKGEGYRGIAGQSINIFVHFYDAEKNFLCTVEGMQLRRIRIPENAVYGRVTCLGPVSGSSAIQFFTKAYDEYIEISGIDFYDTRTTAIAITAVNNVLIENCTYTRAGNSVTPCAVDFEDGWEECQDLYYRNNEVLERSGTITLIDCAGYNHVYEGLKNHQVGIRRRVHGSVVRNVDDKATGSYVKLEYGNNVISKYHRIDGVKTGRIIVAYEDFDYDIGIEKFVVKNCEITEGGSYSKYNMVTYDKCVFTNFAGSDMKVTNSVIYPTSHLTTNLYFDNCIFKNLNEEGGDIELWFNRMNVDRIFDNCKFVGKTTILNKNLCNSGVFNNCEFDDLSMEINCENNVSTQGMQFNNCKINSTRDKFIFLGPWYYSTGTMNVEFNKCDINLGDGTIVDILGMPIGESKIVFNDCNLLKEEGTIITGNKLETKDNLKLDIIFKNTEVNKNLDDSYVAKDDRIKILYQ